MSENKCNHCTHSYIEDGIRSCAVIPESCRPTGLLPDDGVECQWYDNQEQYSNLHEYPDTLIISPTSEVNP